MTTSSLVFIGIKGSILALDRATGEQVWATRLETQVKGRSFVNIVLQNETVIASCDGEVFCLDPLTGNVQWHNPLKGFGTGLATIATESAPGSGVASLLAEQRRIEAGEAAAVTVATTG
jgi:outer membrane protein assembly factor BamB